MEPAFFHWPVLPFFYGGFPDILFPGPICQKNGHSGRKTGLFTAVWTGDRTGYLATWTANQETPPGACGRIPAGDPPRDPREGKNAKRGQTRPCFPSNPREPAGRFRAFSRRIFRDRGIRAQKCRKDGHTGRKPACLQQFAQGISPVISQQGGPAGRPPFYGHRCRTGRIPFLRMLFP